MRIGIDLGGTKTEALLIDSEGKKIFSKRIPTEKNYQGTIKGIADLVLEIQFKYNSIESIGIGMPGSILNKSLTIVGANSQWLNGKPFKKDIESILNRVVSIENDANCFTLSEAVDGAGKKSNVVFGIIIGTGTGGGIVIDKKIHKGRNLIVGEFGHNSLPRTNDKEINLAKPCYCGLKGCIETFLSGPGFEYIFNYSNKTNLRVKDIIKLYEENDKRAEIALHSYVNRLARAISDVINILDPDIVVLGGGMSNIKYIYDNIEKEISRYVFSDAITTKVVKNFHGDSSGVRGAAWL